MRATTSVAIVALVVSACSGDDGVVTAPGATVIPPGATTTSTVAAVGEPTVPATSSSSRRVAVSVESPQLGVRSQLAGDVGGDPFGDFATCSGLARHIASYAVGVGDADGPVRWVSAVTALRIDGPGSYDADVRIELAGGETIDAIGSLTVDAGLTSGTFAASTPEAELVTGTFECEGGAAPALVAGDAGLVEVVALLQLGEAERVVSVAGDDPTVVECPLGAGGDSLLVRVDGDSSTGAIRAFELRVDAAGTGSLSLRVGDGAYEFDDVDVELTGDAGIFAAAKALGPAVDGAFSCPS
jgi:hypothetical protein